ncbi:short-chain dehydrogenase/reductase family 16C member 6-like [Bactrocera neohumeralis]|uniref:short-chain dehydrogenase/reductase family 16C member 6-like n=1 Tax=Bactrocera tryoni TaxID=59916 RepID=UPI001A996493|nr:short-chain dehydrogenase/reductase family 16C member 6-like [Bactrocera tryoni]XP_050333991.1 short-chain dehydrogenase/reductase family 16C member 6-like [Bactrocera neohumeralis]
MVGKSLHKVIVWIVCISLAVFIFPIVLVVSSIITNIESCRRKKEKSIKNEVAVVTGSASGLGKNIAIELAARGCHVAICDINYDLAVTTAKEIAEKYGVKAKAYKVDVTKYDEIVELNEKLTNDIGTATILVNNAGLLFHSDRLKPTVKEIEAMINVNYVSHFWTNRVFMENMKRAKKGYLMAVCSVAGLQALVQSEPYSSAKFAVRTLMRIMRAELKIEGFSCIHLTTVFPYFIRTNARVTQMAEEGGFTKRYPLLEGEEVAQRAVSRMLCGEIEVIIPSLAALIYRLIDLLPQRVQDWLTAANITPSNNI